MGDSETSRELVELQNKIKKLKKDKVKYKEQATVREAEIETLKSRIKALKEEAEVAAAVVKQSSVEADARVRDLTGRLAQAEF